MPEQQVVGRIPEFTTDGGNEEEVNKAVEQPNEDVEQEKENSAEPPADNKPTESDGGEQTAERVSDDTKDGENRSVTKDEAELLVLRATQGLRDEIVSLRKRLRDADTQSERAALQGQITRAEETQDELADLNQEDIETVERIMRAKGYMTHTEAKRMAYESAKKETLEQFLQDFPEYKPENDVDDTKWNALQKEVNLYKAPENPRDIRVILERAHREISKSKGDNGLQAKQKQVKTASVGAGGTQKSSSKGRKLTDEQVAAFRAGGWSDEEIAAMQK